MNELYKEEYCSYDLSVRLRNVGYDKVSDKVYCECAQVTHYIKRLYPGLTEDEYYKLTVDGGGVLDYKDVFVKSQRLVNYEYRDNGYVMAPRLITVMSWLEQKYKMKIVLEPIDSTTFGYTTNYKIKLIYNDTVWNFPNNKPYYLYTALEIFIKQAVEILENNLKCKN